MQNSSPLFSPNLSLCRTGAGGLAFRRSHVMPHRHGRPGIPKIARYAAQARAAWHSEDRTLCRTGTGGLAFRRSHVRDTLAATNLVICGPHLHRASGAQDVLSHDVFGGNGQSIGSSDSDAILHRWLWSTATGSCLLDYFNSITTCS